MENKRYENANESGLAISEIDLAFQADVNLLRLGFRIPTDEKQRKEAYLLHCRLLSKYQIKKKEGEKRK